MKSFQVCQFLLTMSMAVGFQNAMQNTNWNGSTNRALRSTASSNSSMEETKVSNRRKFLNGVAATISTVLSSPSLVTAAEDDEATKLTDVYFGVGCFWHIQHEFVVAEKNLLGRGPKTFTSRTGYAGGTKTDNGKVCTITMSTKNTDGQ